MNINRLRIITIIVMILLLANSMTNAKDPDNNNIQTGSIAITIGTPAGLNLNYSKISSNKWGWTLSGGYLPSACDNHLTGFQFGGLYRIGKSNQHYSAISFYLGYLDYKSCCDEISDPYVGSGIIYKWRFLYSELDLYVGNWDDVWSEIQMGFQAGIVLKTFY